MKRVGDQIVLSYTVNSPKKLFNPEGDETQKNRPRKKYATEEFVVKAIDNALENKHYATEEFVVKAIDNALENKHYATEEFVKKEIAASEERTKQ
jgi:hypothetical protein